MSDVSQNHPGARSASVSRSEHVILLHPVSNEFKKNQVLRVFRVRATVLKMEGKCPYHKKGDYIEVEDDLLTIPDSKKVCIWSLSSLLPFLSAVQRKHDEPSDWLSDVDYVQCPDSSVEVLWEIKKTPV